MMLLLALASLYSSANAIFYLPGVAPMDFLEGDNVYVKVNKLTSVKTQLPYKYYDRLPFCVPDPLVDTVENLGEILLGDRIENSNYNVVVDTDYPCRVLCGTEKLPKEELADLASLIENDYRVNLIVDNLPAAMRKVLQSVTGETTTLYDTGFPVGFMGDPQEFPGSQEGKAYLNNHLNMKFFFHENPDAYTGRRIVGFEVEPESIAHSSDYDPADPASFPKSCLKRELGPLVIDPESEDTEIVFTYSVTWEWSETPWANRWDQYLVNLDAQIHWFSIINSLMIVLFLTGMVGMIMLRTLHADFRRYNQVEPNEEAEETGWKLVHGDVFRPPTNPMLLSVLVGSGVQVTASTVVLLTFAVLGFLSPANRGGLITAMVVLIVVMGVFAGYFSTRLYKSFKGQAWKKATLLTAFGCPGFVFGIFFFLNFFIWGEKSSGAVPFPTLMAIIALWFGVSVPLVFFGSYFAFKKPSEEPPVGVNQIPRQIPEQPWYMGGTFSILMGGVLPFGAVFIELFFIMTAVWGHQLYYVFTFLFLVFLILIITCAEITIVMTYFQLCSEDYHWHWRAFLTSGASALYMFAYSCFYYTSKLTVTKVTGSMLYFGYSAIFSLLFFVMTGAIGYYAALLFVRKIYSSVKVD
jgi:transmembrane 9 superfamily protein 2/4